MTVKGRYRMLTFDGTGDSDESSCGHTREQHCPRVSPKWHLECDGRLQQHMEA